MTQQELGLNLSTQRTRKAVFLDEMNLVVPRQVGTGGKTQQLGISKRGDTYLRTLLIAGARAVIAKAEKSSWITRLLDRRHYNVVVVALANKMARTAWADLVKWSPLEQLKA